MAKLAKLKLEFANSLVGVSAVAQQDVAENSAKKLDLDTAEELRVPASSYPVIVENIMAKLEQLNREIATNVARVKHQPPEPQLLKLKHLRKSVASQKLRDFAPTTYEKLLYT